MESIPGLYSAMGMQIPRGNVGTLTSSFAWNSMLMTYIALNSQKHNANEHTGNMTSIQRSIREILAIFAPKGMHSNLYHKLYSLRVTEEHVIDIEQGIWQVGGDRKRKCWSLFFSLKGTYSTYHKDFTANTTGRNSIGTRVLTPYHKDKFNSRPINFTGSTLIDTISTEVKLFFRCWMLRKWIMK